MIALGIATVLIIVFLVSLGIFNLILQAKQVTMGMKVYLAIATTALTLLFTSQQIELVGCEVVGGEYNIPDKTCSR